MLRRILYSFQIALLFAASLLSWKLSAQGSGFIAQYHLDETSGTVAADSSGNGLNGALGNGPTWVAGRANGGLRFDASNDFVDLGNAPALNPANAISISAWIRPTSVTLSQFIVVKDSLPSGRLQYFLRTQSGGRIRMGIYASSENYFTTGAVLTPNTWQFVAGVWDGSVIRIYLNGQLVGTSGAVTGSMSDNGVNARMGMRQDGYLPFGGTIDEVSIFDRALSAAEILSQYNSVVQDATSPAASITAPQQNGAVLGTVTVAASASDNVGVAGVRFFVDGAAIGAEDTTAPYQVSLNTTTLTNGPHQLTAVARDAAGNTGTSAGVTVLVDNPVPDTTPPQVAVTSPADGTTVVGIVPFTASAADNIAVAGVQFKVDGNNLGAEAMSAPYGVSLDSRTLANGSHQLTAVARDTSNNIASATITFNVNNPVIDVTPPTLSNGQPSGLFAAGTTQVQLGVNSNEDASCRYSTTPGTTYDAMSVDFTSTGGRQHFATVVGLTDAQSYTYYVRCVDAAGNANTADFTITFAIGSPLPLPITQYHLDDAAGLLAMDSSGNANHGTLGNGAAWTAGQFAGALGFDGVNDYVELGNSPILNPSSAITIMAWIKPVALTPSQFIVVKDALPSGRLQYFLRMQNNGGLRMGIYAASENYFTTGPALTASTWQHVAGVWDGSVIRIYRNGQLVGTSGPVTGTMSNNGASARLGARQDNYLPFRGAMDEVQIYDRALTANEILAIYQTPPATGDTTPPSAAILAPSDNTTVSGTIAVRASAADNAAVKHVELYVDGVLYGRDAVPPYEFTLSTSLLSNGTHTLRARAADDSANSADSAAVSIQVSNIVSANRPDIVFVLTDDYRFDSMTYMPLTSALLQNESVVFSNAFVAQPVCCPSRASILTGQYSHNHGVWENVPPQGGLSSFNETSTIATWLKQAGYRTGLFGKYLNGYDSLQPGQHYVPAGWDDWHAGASLTTIDFNYWLFENGTLNTFGNQVQDYGTDVLKQRAVQFIETTPTNQPLFLYFAPHNFLAHPSDTGKFANWGPWRPISFNEADVSDKPAWVRALPSMTAGDLSNIDSFSRQQLEALQSTDRAVAEMIDALKRTNRYQNTVFVITSDNGMSWGEHRWVNKKWCVYDECTRVPLWVRVPGVPARTEGAVTVNVDFAPTFAEWAGVVPPTKVDGVSLATLLQNPASAWPAERLLEFIAISGGHGVQEKRFRAVRSQQYIYVEYDNGDQEFYDVIADPFQLLNRVADPALSATVSAMRKILTSVKGL